MRYSVDHDDPGAANWARSRPLRVLLDGVERTRVVTADEERGLIVRHRTDERGQLMLNAERTAVLRETLHGVVVVMPKGDQCAP